MKKFILALCFVFIFALSSSANIVNTQYDAQAKANRLSKIASTDYYSFYNHSEIVGIKETDFRSATENYRSLIRSCAESVKSLSEQAVMLDSIPDMSQEEKELQKKKIFAEVDSKLYEADKIASSYIYAIGRFLPSVTYYKYSKKFKEYYNSFNLTPNKLN